MLTAEKLQNQIEEETKDWEERQEQIQQQFAMEQGAHLGRVKLLEEQIAEMSEDVSEVVEAE